MPDTLTPQMFDEILAWPEVRALAGPHASIDGHKAPDDCYLIQFWPMIKFRPAVRGGYPAGWALTIPQLYLLDPTKPNDTLEYTDDGRPPHTTRRPYYDGGHYTQIAVGLITNQHPYAAGNTGHPSTRGHIPVCRGDELFHSHPLSAAISLRLWCIQSWAHGSDPHGFISGASNWWRDHKDTFFAAQPVAEAFVVPSAAATGLQVGYSIRLMPSIVDEAIQGQAQGQLVQTEFPLAFDTMRAAYEPQAVQLDV